MFCSLDGRTEQDPFVAMGEAGFNAVRVEIYWNSCSTVTSHFNNSGDVASREVNSLLDSGCIDIAVMTAASGKEQHMKVVLTINMGAAIPLAWQSFNCTHMLVAIDGEVRRHLDPFLQVGIQPDAIFLEIEGSAGFLFSVTTNGAEPNRGVNSPATSAGQLKEELCGILPTGHSDAYAQLADYYKQQILSCQEALEGSGFHPDLTCFGLHSQ